MKAIAILILLGARCLFAADTGFGPPISVPRDLPKPAITRPPADSLIDQPLHAALRKSAGCIECHQGIEDMHASPNVILGCTDCHGGNPTPGLTQRKAHVLPNNPLFFQSSANPIDSNVLLNHESAEFIRFINPGDLRVANQTCGACHQQIIDRVQHSMMNHGAMLWGAALYNNGAVPHKNPRYGQAYGQDGAPLRLINPTPVTPEDTLKHGILPYLDPLPRGPISQPGNTLRVFEQGGSKPAPLGNPNARDLPGRATRRLSDRGFGTGLRIDPVFYNIQKTRLHDPLLGFMGSNDHPGDYRSSGCSACHVIYANDRSPSNSDFWSKYGHQGLSFSGDPSIPKNERGHPIKHQFTRSIPSSQCMNCHMHQGNLFVNPFLGYTWWDQESDGELLYPKEQKDPTDAELFASLRKNPEAAAARGLWGDLDFLEKSAELNPQMKHTQIADYHGHGWIFRAVFKKDRKGELLDLDDIKIAHTDPDKFKKAVHLKDIHLARGMQCVDCHFDSDVHGNGNLYGEPRAATAIECIDCHGQVDQRPTLITSGKGGQIDLAKTSTPFGPRFAWQGKRLFQQSMLDAGRRWEVPQTIDTTDPASKHYNAKSAYAKTLRRDGETWGNAILTNDCPRESELAHNNKNISCQVCHTSWATSCYGCHLPTRFNQMVAANKYEGATTRNYTSYNPQVVRDDVFMLGRDSSVKDQRLAVIRSSSAVIVSAQNANRESIYSQQQTFSAEGYSGQAFNPHFAHTTSGRGTTKNCADCHISKQNDNNAIMTQLLGFGTGTVNFFGRYAYVATGKSGLSGVAWTEREEPQAALGSHLHKIAYPKNFQQHEAAQRKLTEAYHHDSGEILDLAVRGEYLYTACGANGFEVFDIANIDNKAASARIISAPVSPLGQRAYVRTKYATSIALPSTLALDPARTRLPENEEQPIHMLYAHVYVTDLEEGLVLINVATLVDGNPDNNFLDGKIAFNPDGKLTGARQSYVAGRWLYVVADQGLFVIDINDPAHPKLAGELTQLNKPRALALQFRYAFITDADGLKVIDITEPTKPALIPGAEVKLKSAQRLYVARTYAYVANGPEGLAIIDIEKPTQPALAQMFNADGALNDTRALQIGSVNASMFAHVADGKNGLRILQLISPENVPGHMGFSPAPNPKLIATYPTRAPALAISRGLDRDRVADETANQTVVFGRRGARPLNAPEMTALYRPNSNLFTVENVSIQNGSLTTLSGTNLTPTLKPTSEPEPTEPRNYPQRLMQRGK